MSALAVAGAILRTVVGAGATLCWMAFIAAGMPHSSPAQEVSLCRFFWGVAAGDAEGAAHSTALPSGTNPCCCSRRAASGRLAILLLASPPPWSDPGRP